MAMRFGWFVVLAAAAAGCRGRSEIEARLPAWREPVNIGAAVNSASNDVFPMLSPDGLSLYFASDRPGGLVVDGATGFEALDIYVAHRRSRTSRWDRPQHLDAPVNTRRADHSAAFSDDGHWLYFASTRPGGCGHHDLYRAYREDTHDDLAWGAPQNLGCTVNSAADDSCPFLVTGDGQGNTLLYFVSKRAGGPGSWDIYVSHMDERNQSFGPALLVANVNSADFDGHFDADHGMLWSGNKAGHGGGDLWFTRRNKQGEWTTPTNVGPPVNTANNEGCFTLSRDGTTLVFTSDRPGSLGEFDLFVSQRFVAER